MPVCQPAQAGRRASLPQPKAKGPETSLEVPSPFRFSHPGVRVFLLGRAADECELGSAVLGFVSRGLVRGERLVHAVADGGQPIG